MYEDEAGKNKLIVVFCARLDRVMEGEWLVVRMMDGKGKSSGVSLVMRVRVEKVQSVSIELAYFCSFCLCIG